jgi:hypothetical protein
VKIKNEKKEMSVCSVSVNSILMSTWARVIEFGPEIVSTSSYG